MLDLPLDSKFALQIHLCPSPNCTCVHLTIKEGQSVLISIPLNDGEWNWVNTSVAMAQKERDHAPTH